MRFHNAPAPSFPARYNGFTLVEISIVMMIIGLLIGGIFGGVKLIDNANIQKTAQDIKSIESGALTFKHTYGKLPGDLRNPDVRLTNCTIAPCAVAGNGNGILGDVNVTDATETLTVTSEKFTIWHHLSAANLIREVKNVNDMNWGEGQLEAAIGGGYRINGYWTGAAMANKTFTGHVLRVADIPSAIRSAGTPDQIRPYTCDTLRQLDAKIDDGMPRMGKLGVHTSCLENAADETTRYANPTLTTGFSYYLAW